MLHAGGVVYKIETPSKSIPSSGDTAPCNSLIKLGQNVGVAVLECSFPNEESIKGEHLCPKLVATLVTKMKAKRLILTHMYPECQGKEKETHQEARNHYAGEVIFAEDKMEIEV